jgi:hypothetical protein
MKKTTFLLIFLLVTAFIHSQVQFTMKENGLTPKFSTSTTDASTNNELYKKTLTWMKANEKTYNLSLDNKIENEVIDITSIKGNALSLNKQYFNVKYKIRISFEKEQYRFEPLEIQLKVNSKYDMGWKDFDLNNGALYYKKGKVIRKYRSYIQDLTVLLNEINFRLNTFLK